MKKSVSLKELPNKYIDSGLSITGLAEYLSVTEETVKKWENYFNFSTKTTDNNERIFSKEQIDDFLKIKESLDSGRSLKETRDRLFNLSFSIISNPFENSHNFSDLNFEKSKLANHATSESLVKPFLTQLNKVNQRVEDLLREKTKIVEETAVEKAELTSKVEILKSKNEHLLEEKEKISSYINKRETEIEKSLLREENIGSALKISQELLYKKEEEISELRSKVEQFYREMQNKDNLIYDQNIEIDQLLEKQNKKWWHFWNYS